jgi:hypothetical protein
MTLHQSPQAKRASAIYEELLQMQAQYKTAETKVCLCVPSNFSTTSFF